jgi:hypothetical protein
MLPISFWCLGTDVGASVVLLGSKTHRPLLRAAVVSPVPLQPPKLAVGRRMRGVDKDARVQS